MKKYLAALLVCVALTGCEFIDFSEKAPERATYIVKAAENGEPVVIALEDATGATLAPEFIEKGSEISEKAVKFTKVGQQVLGIASLIPGAQPYTGAAAGILGALTILAGGAADFFRRRAKRNATAVKTMIKATEPLNGSGEAVKAALPSNAVGEVIEEAYKEVMNG